MNNVDTVSVLNIGSVFTLLFVMLGPVKVLGPFAQLTRDIDEATVRKISLRAIFFSIAAVLVSGIAGTSLLARWHVSVASLEMAGGLIFFVVGLRIVLEQYQPATVPPAPLPAEPTAAALRLTFPTIVTPYGVAAIMVLLARSQDTDRSLTIVGVLLVVMAFNYLAMRLAGKVMGGVTLLVLRIVGAVLGVLQVAMAVEMIVRGMQELRMITA